MAPTKSADDNLKFIMLVIASSESFKPDYREVFGKAGINTPSNAQRRFKKLVEDAGFVLVNGRVISPDESETAPIPKAPKTPKKASRTKKTVDTLPSKKRKQNPSDFNEASDSDAVTEDDSVAAEDATEEEA